VFLYWVTLSCSTKSSSFTIRLFILCDWLISSTYLCCAQELVAQSETSRSSFNIVFTALSGIHFCTHQIPNVIAHLLLITGWKHIVHLTLGIPSFLVFCLVNVRCHNKHLNVWIMRKHFVYWSTRHICMELQRRGELSIHWTLKSQIPIRHIHESWFIF